MVKCVGTCRLTKDVQKIGYTATGKLIIAMSVAIDNGKNDTTFIELIAFSRLAEICEQYLAKGSLIEVEFIIRNNNYKNKDGKAVYKERYVLNQVHFLNSKKIEDNSTSQKADDVPW